MKAIALFLTTLALSSTNEREEHLPAAQLQESPQDAIPNANNIQACQDLSAYDFAVLEKIDAACSPRGQRLMRQAAKLLAGTLHTVELRPPSCPGNFRFSELHETYPSVETFFIRPKISAEFENKFPTGHFLTTHNSGFSRNSLDGKLILKGERAFLNWETGFMVPESQKPIESGFMRPNEDIKLDDFIALSFKDNIFTFERNAKFRSSNSGISAFGSHQYSGDIEGSEMKLTFDASLASYIFDEEVSEKDNILPHMGFEIVGFRYRNGNYFPSKEHLQSSISESYGMSRDDYLTRNHHHHFFFTAPSSMSESFEKLMTEDSAGTANVPSDQ